MEQKLKIAFFDAKPYDIKSFEAVNKEYQYKIKFFKNKLNLDTVFQTKGFDAICIFVNDMVNQEIVQELTNNKVKLIALRCSGYNNVDLKEVFQKIHVMRVPAYSPHAIAEHAAALMMSLNRKIHKAYYRTHDNNFNIDGLLGFDMYGKTAGIIGTGKIGKVLIKILKGFGMNVLAYDLYPDHSFAESAGYEYTRLEKIYQESDIISLHCPLTKDTYHLISQDTISQMKDGVMIINTGRGQLIHTKDLIDALKTGKIGSAGLDVYEEESEYFFEDFSNQIVSDDVLARLLTFPNVLITSHQAFFTQEALNNIAVTTLDNIKQYEKGQNLLNEICYKCGKPNCEKKEKGRCFFFKKKIIFTEKMNFEC